MIWKLETYRPAIHYRIKAALKDGKITAYHIKEAAINSNAYSIIPNNFPAGAIPNYQFDAHLLKSNITTGAWRAPYTNFLAFAEQSFLDEVAQKLKVDETQLRIDLFNQAKPAWEALKAAEEQFKDDEEALAKAKDQLTPAGNYEPDRSIGVINLVKEKSNWNNQPDGVVQGICMYFSHRTYVAEVANVVLKDGKPHIDKVFAAIDCGLVVNPDAASNLAAGGVIDGIGHAMYGEFKFENGKPLANNFHQYHLIRMTEAPDVEVYFVPSEVHPTGLGEPTLPPAGGAVANALAKLTGNRIYNQPLVKEFDVVG